MIRTKENNRGQETGIKEKEDKLMLLCGICAACLVGIMVVYVTVL